MATKTTKTPTIVEKPPRAVIIDPDRRPIPRLRVKVKIHYNVIMGGYPRITEKTYQNQSGPGNIRSLEWGGYDENRNLWYYNPMNTKAYGEYIIDKCQRYGINVYTTWWEPGDPDTVCWNNFESAFNRAHIPDNDLGDLRFAYMFGVQNWPSSQGAILNMLERWASDAANTNRYAYIKDQEGNQRPILMTWGKPPFLVVQNLFEQFIVQIREIYMRHLGKYPFIIMSQHVLDNRQIIPYTDAVFMHQCHIPQKDDQLNTITTLQSKVKTEEVFNAHLDSMRKLTNTFTNKMIIYIPGTMPQFNRDLVPGNPWGRVEADHRDEVEQMFTLVRNFAPTVYLEPTPTNPDYKYIEHKWVSLTSMDEIPEGTCIMPSGIQPESPDYSRPECEYGYDFVELVKSIFADRIVLKEVNTLSP